MARFLKANAPLALRRIRAEELGGGGLLGRIGSALGIGSQAG